MVVGTVASSDDYHDESSLPVSIHHGDDDRASSDTEGNGNDDAGSTEYEHEHLSQSHQLLGSFIKNMGQLNVKV